MQKLIRTLKELSQTEDAFRYVSGDCHHLALAIQSVFGGDLVGILRHEIKDDGQVYSTGYSHMVVEINKELIDIDGINADERWVEQWPSEPDEDDLTSDFEYVNLKANEVEKFVTDWNGVFNQNSVAEIKSKIKDILRNNNPEYAFSI